MNIIESTGDVLAINVFTVRPENQQALIDCIRDAGDPSTIPGLLSMHLLRSLDGTQVINHMRWASRTAFDDATAHNAVIASTRDRVGELIDKAPARYEIIPLRPRATA
ncbi:MAG TPA: antibiotic biosynthesis monooxygenase family protein [Pseudonocardiaceae bacterium]|nr:antibiotic biosynthesis monooxygenase family protein [Pseudonocardiaceae bacterium]